MIIHTLKSGATILTTSPHPFIFSDGSVSLPQDKELCDMLTLQRETQLVRTIAGMKVNRTRMVLSADQMRLLRSLTVGVDLVLVPFPVLTALRESGETSDLENVVAFNATTETQRSSPQEKVVDIQNWSCL